MADDVRSWEHRPPQPPAETIVTQGPPVTATEPVECCPLCGSDNVRPWRARCQDRLYQLVPDRFSYSRCRHCRLAFLAPRVPEIEVGRLYPDEYQPYRKVGSTAVHVPSPSPVARLFAGGPLQRGAGFLFAMLDRRFPDRLDQELEATYTPSRAGLTLLDFGCGSAEFLDEMRPRGWCTFGADFIPGVVRSVRSAGHHAEVVEDGFWAGVAAESVEVVRLNHVLEHLYRPRAVLSEVRRCLAPGGIAHIAMPNPDSVWSAAFQSRWFDLECPRHVMLYPPVLLRSLLLDLGFRQVRIVHQVLTTVVVRSWGYVLHDRGRMEHAQISALVHDDVRARALRLPAKMAAVVGRADRYHAFASA